MKAKPPVDKPPLDERVRAALAALGIDLADLSCADGSTPPRVVVVAASLKDSLAGLSQSVRDQVLMVRVDAETIATLDRWVTTGAARSRSEAAALFLREGLAVRAADLGAMSGAIDRLEAAKRDLEIRAAALLGARERRGDRTARRRTANRGRTKPG
jgi:hypothetical protein